MTCSLRIQHNGYTISFEGPAEPQSMTQLAAELAELLLEYAPQAEEAPKPSAPAPASSGAAWAPLVPGGKLYSMSKEAVKKRRQRAAKAGDLALATPKS